MHLLSVAAAAAAACALVAPPLALAGRPHPHHAAATVTADITADVTALAGERRLISLSEDPADRHWMTDADIQALRIARRGFMDVTDGDLDAVAAAAAPAMPSAFVFPTNLTQQERVQPLLEQIDIERMTRFMTKFTSFRNRYYKSRYGKEAGDWLFAYVTELCKDVVANPEKNGMSVSVRQVSHAWGQSSIIVHIEAYDRNKQQQQQQPSTTTGDGVTIIGAHLDSVNLYNPYWGRSPGADDDGSGTTTTIEALTLLIQSGYVPPNPLEFHWYSAEEGGLLGSAKIASLYRNSGVLVRGMLQADMTGFRSEGKPEVLGVVTDFTSLKLTEFLRLVMRTYSGIDVVDTKCGYGCSDHASFNQAGYPSAFFFESDFADQSPFIHTTRDDIDTINFNHIATAAKAVLGFAVELSHA